VRNMHCLEIGSHGVSKYQGFYANFEAGKIIEKKFSENKIFSKKHNFKALQLCQKLDK